MNVEQLKPIVETALLTAGEPLSLQRLRDLFSDLSVEERPASSDLRAALAELADDYEHRGIELKEIASGFCFQAKAEYVPWVKKLWQERPLRYSRALLETLAIVAYRQPVTRAEIEDIRGVAVSTNIVKTLLDHEWIQIVGQREVPGRPSVYATTRQFLDHFNLKSLEELPALLELAEVDLTAVTQQLAETLMPPVAEASAITESIEMECVSVGIAELESIEIENVAMEITETESIAVEIIETEIIEIEGTENENSEIEIIRTERVEVEIA